MSHNPVLVSIDMNRPPAGWLPKVLRDNELVDAEPKTKVLTLRMYRGKEVIGKAEIDPGNLSHEGMIEELEMWKEHVSAQTAQKPGGPAGG